MDYESGVSFGYGTLCGWAAAFVTAAVLAVACGDQQQAPQCDTSADCSNGASCQNGSCIAGGTAGDDGSGSGGSGSGSGDDGSGGGGTGAADTATSGSGGASGAGSTSGGGGGSSACDPDARLFDGDPLVASISIDEANMACSAHKQLGDDPQFVLTVRDTGLSDVSATGGLTIQSSSLGTYINDTNVTGLTTDVPVKMDATSPGGVPLLVQFTIDKVGPQITMVSVEWNPA